MKKFLHLIKVIFISPEFLFIICTIFLAEIFPDFFIFLSLKIQEKDEILKYLLLLPPTLALACYKFGKEIWLPNEKSKLLYSWPDFYALKQAIVIGLVFVTLSSIIAILTWIFLTYLNPFTSGLIISLVLGVSGITTITMYLASIKINEILLAEN